jgi:hypothetical protein
MGSTTAQSFRFLFDTESADGSSMKVEGALAATAMYMKSTVVSADGKKQETEIYYVDEYMYTKDSSGQWQKLPFKQTQLLDLMKTFDFNKLLKEAQDEGDLELKLVGADVVRGVPCAKYEFVSKDPDSTGKGFLYLGVTDGLIYRMEGESTSTEGLTKVFMEYWDYNKDIVIETPI